MRNKFDEYRAQLDGWFRLNDWQSIDKVWRTPEQWAGHGLPEWVGAVLYIEEHELLYVLNGYGDTVADYGTFEAILDKAGVWWEMENCCVVWVYDVAVLDAFMETKGITSGKL
jgi:hypothetical protein